MVEKHVLISGLRFIYSMERSRIMRSNVKKIKFIMMIFGNLFMGIAVAILRMSRFGTDPFTCMNLGVSSFLNISFGTYQLAVNVVIFLFVLWKGRHCIGLGTIVNMAGIGYVADFGVFVLTKILGNAQILPLAMRIFMMILAVILCSFAAAMYMEVDMGIAPYDAFGVIIEESTNGKIPFKAARVVTDVICVVIGFSFGSIIGVATLITAFCMGPLIGWFRGTCMEKLIIKYSNL